MLGRYTTGPLPVAESTSPSAASPPSPVDSILAVPRSASRMRSEAAGGPGW